MASLCSDPGNAFERCLINTLLNLGVAGLQALQKLIQAELALVDVAIANLIIQLSQYDLLGQFVKKEADFLEAEFDSILSILNGLPLGLLDKDCVSWAGLNDGINGFLQNEVRPPVEQILDAVKRYTSIQGELADLQSEYEQLKTLLNDTLELLQILILNAKCAELESGQNIVAA